MTIRFVLLFAVATTATLCPRLPAQSSVPHPEAVRALATATAKSFDALKQAHIADYQTFFRRVEFALPANEAAKAATDERLKTFQKGRTTLRCPRCFSSSAGIG